MCDKAILQIGGTLESIPDCCKNQQMCDKAVDNYPRVLKFVPDCYKTQNMCDKTVNTYPSTIQYVPDRFKTQETCDKTVNTYPSTIQYVPGQFKTQETCDKIVDRCFFVFDSIPDQFKTQKKCVTEDTFLVAHCPDKYITQKMCNEAVDDSLVTSKLIPNWLSRMIKKLYAALYADDNILYFNEDSGNILFSFNEMGILTIDLNNINLDNNFDEDDLYTIIIVRLLTWHIKFEKRKALKKRQVKN